MATTLAGALMIITIIAQVMGVIDFANIAEESTTGTYALLTWLVVLTVILLQGGLVALYAERSEAMGVLGLVGFVVAFIGTALTLGYLWAEAFVVPAVAEIAPTQLDPIHDIGTWVGARVLARVLFGIGWFLFGLAAHQARVYPDWAARLLVIGAIISLLPFQGAFLVLAVGLVWVGFVLFSRKAASHQQPSRVR